MESISTESKSIIVSNRSLQLFKEDTDLIGVRKLIHKTIEVCYSAYYDKPIVSYFKDSFNNENIKECAKKGFTIVYLIDRKIVGTGTLKEGQITALFIDPAFRGRGIGKRIVYSLLHEAENKNIKTIQLSATPSSEGFFKHLGFQTISVENIWIESIFPLDLYVMEKWF